MDDTGVMERNTVIGELRRKEDGGKGRMEMDMAKKDGNMQEKEKSVFK